MLRPSFRHAVSALLAAAALLVPVAAAAPASAEMTVVQDPRGDVWAATMSLVDEDFTVQRSDVQTNVDVRNVKIAHSARALKFWVRFVDLRRNQDMVAVDFMLRTPERRMLAMTVSFDRATDTMLLRRNGAMVGCRDLRVELQVPQDELELDIPRRCLGRPEWVKVGGVTSTVDLGFIDELIETGEEPESITAYGDLIGSAGYRRLAWTPRLHRG